MQQRTAALAGVGMAACAAAAVILLSAGLAADQRAERHGYQEALAQQRRAAGRSLRAHQTPAPRRPSGELCVRGVDGFAASLRAALPAAGRADAMDALDDAGRLDMPAFTALSDLALRAERWLEQARGAPALPQRMGRTRAPAGPDADAEPAWQPLAPARVACGSGEAYAAVPLDLERPASQPAPKSDATQSMPEAPKRVAPGPRARVTPGQAARRRSR
jgi:hypothetical protein